MFLKWHFNGMNAPPRQPVAWNRIPRRETAGFPEISGSSNLSLAQRRRRKVIREFEKRGNIVTPACYEPSDNVGKLQVRLDVR